MKNIVIKSIIVFFLFININQYVNAQVNVSDSMTAAQLVQTLVGTGISFSNATLDCPATQSGTFNVITSNLGLTGGVILTTGAVETDAANNIFGVNEPQSIFASSCNDNFPYPPTGGGNRQDSNLNELITVGTYDKCVLEFDFIPDGDSLLFDYVFGSEEYDVFSCTQFNDVFAFFLSGPGIVGSPNIALIPGTTIPVAINSTTDPAVTQPGSLTDCLAMGPGSPFAQYYNDNSNGQTITYYGLTKILTARAAVIPCTTYHIKLAIADGADCSYDSGVFLEANSFRSSSITIDLKSSLAPKDSLLVEGCADSSLITVKRNTAFPIPQTVYLSYSGTATEGADYNMLPDSVIIPANDTVASFYLNPFQDNIQEGVESIVINLLNPCNGNILDSAVFLLRDVLPAALLSVDTFMCGAAPVRLQIEGDPDFQYLWTSSPASNIQDPNSQNTFGFPDSTTTYFIRGSYLGCFTDTFSFVATVEPLPIVDIITPDLDICIGDPLKIQVYVGPDYFSDYNYTWAPVIGLSDPFIKEPEFFITAPGEYKYVLTVQTGTLGCTGTDSIFIKAKPAAQLTDVTADFIAKYGDKVQLNANGALYYTWLPTTLIDYPNINNPTVSALDPTTFTVIGMNEFGCKDTAFVKMDIDYTMFESIPNAFTPNNDGKNDFFKITNLKFQRLLEFRIFNRWGEQVFNTVDPLNGWDGTHKGVPQEIGVYQYIIRVAIPNGISRTYKGDVSLIR